ncbi:Phospho-2-dehydro-3-deoxyheptonate aldolase Trp-sensitive [Dissostichus eleginoides]|uniref:Phospho-2-dehydro-3-deoxyheptonate aldolase Trp-sensitive n=1 Tax=Dissostichus eleginoides TaxID=100907 RepID=A0AAD9BI37_DISEL|nr:Phospho-2-dehydro-3-deoxyheptonate aldolase Trp-sensitive [Dissostichus eleginoides]
MRAFNKDMDEGPYILLYPDCSEVVNVPGSEKPFTLAEYKKDLGKAYARITLFICLEKHFRGGDNTSDSDSDIVITSRSTAEFNQADTVVFEFEPRNKSTPKHKPKNEGKALGHSSTTQHGQIVISDTEDMGPPKTNTDKTTCYGTYTDLYAPCVEEEDEELVAVNMTSLVDTEM